jgi:hypothetical protein
MNEEYYYQPQQQQQMPRYYGDQATAPISEAKPDFTKWLFSFREQVITPLKHIWKGEDLVNGVWQPASNPMMNDKGIRWCISLIESYLNIAVVVTNLNKDEINFRMREAVNVIWSGVCEQYIAFELDKVNISRICEEIESKIYFILKGPEYNVYRIFFTKTYQVSEVKQTALSDNRTSGGFWKPSSLFGDQNNNSLM